MSRIVDETRLARIEARATLATPGPWAAGHIWACQHHPEPCPDRHGCDSPPRIGVAVPEEQSNGRHITVAECGDVGDLRHESASVNDAYFIAAAREDIPWLVAEVRRLASLLRKDGAA